MASSLDFHEFIHCAINHNDPTNSANLQECFQYLDSIHGIELSGDSAEADSLTIRLLLVLSHYISAMATTHGLQLGYVEINNNKKKPTLATKIGALTQVYGFSIKPESGAQKTQYIASIFAYANEQKSKNLTKEEIRQNMISQGVNGSVAEHVIKHIYG